MKKSILLLIVLFLSFNLFAQKGISFQGIARDAAGNAITGETVSVEFTIGSFNETQNLATDDFGIFSAIIGSVNTDDFDDLIFANIDENLVVNVDGTPIYNGKFSTVPYAKAAENGVPVGSIMPWAGAVTSGTELEEPILGWVVCNGANLGGDVKFDKLKTVLSNAWGTGKVPDLRGAFLRGVNNGRADVYADPDAATRVAVNAGNSGDNVGSFQADGIETHTSVGSTTTDGSHEHTESRLNQRKIDEEDDDHDPNTWSGADALHTRPTSGGGAHNHDVSVSYTGIDETRPVNAGVNFIIKY